MKVIKRNGQIVDFDREKIRVAIQKANKEVRLNEMATNDDIDGIIAHIEDLAKKRILVEDIQDIIEEKLMELQKYKLAKKYIVYRYTRALVRKQNTTDESILGVLRNENNVVEENSNKNSMLASKQRDYIAGEVSKDLTKRMLLPEKISKAHEQGIIYFHDADYFIHPVLNCCLVNIGDMLDNGTVMYGKMIESPKSFQVACIVTTQIIAAMASNQYGGQSIDMTHLGKYLRVSYDKYKKELSDKFGNKMPKDLMEELVETRVESELKAGIQTIQYQINTLMTTNGHFPFVTLFLHLDENDPYIKENAMIIEEILKQRCQGIKNEAGEFITPEFPKLVYVLDECNCLKGGKYDYLTKLAVKCSSKGLYPDYISAKKMRENYEGNVFSPMGCRSFLSPWKDKKGNYKFEGRFNQGVVSLNLPQIGLESKGNEDEFLKLLDERLEICKEALMCRHYALLGTNSDISPIHWQHGAISRLNKGEKIDSLLYGGYSTLSLGYIGIYELTKLMKGVSHTTDEGKKFAFKVMNYLKDTTIRWKKETNIEFVLYGTPSESLCYRFAKIDKEKYGTVKDITDKGFYTNSYQIDAKEQFDVFSKLKFESEFQDISKGGAISSIEISDMDKDTENMETIVKFIYENIQYAEFNKKNENTQKSGASGKGITNKENVVS